MHSEETIAAIATAYGEGGIGILRISGEKAKDILSNIFISHTGKMLDRRLTYGKITDPMSGKTIDEVLAVFMPAPHTYTREDVVEIDCHGSIVSLGKILELILRSGARLAEPGEFTKRAFLSGRLDLSQAEAVIDLVRAKTGKAFDVALGGLSGDISVEIRRIRETLMSLLVNLTVNIDYPDEDIEEMTYEQVENSILIINDMIEKLILSADTGRMIKEGIAVVIAGSPNVGKSSLMNAFLKENRAIVTEIPGTTRDTIEEMIHIREIPIRLIDTAGIRETEDAIEKIGIEKSKEAWNKADLILLMVDGSAELSEADMTLLQYARDKKAIVLINKMDLPQKILDTQISTLLPEAKIINTAVTKAEGLAELESKIEQLVYSGGVRQEGSLLITSVRQKNLLERGRTALNDAFDMARRKEALDFIEIDVRRCWELLGEIIGETATEEIINEVFANFCLGK